MNSEQLIEAIEAAEFTARSYSGRGMHGKECVGFTTEDSTVKAIIEIMRQNDFDDSDEREKLLDALENARTDSMGRETIIYFPSMKWPAEDGSDDNG